MHRTLKKLFSWKVGVLCVFGLSIAALASAQVSIGFPTGFAGFSSQDLKDTIENIVRIVLGFVGIIFLLLLLYGGFTWMTSGGDERKISQAKRIIVSAVIGLVVTLSSYAIAAFVISRFGGALSSGPGGPGGGGPGGFGIALGGDVLESHYPGRNATDIARNTRIFVTFKEPMNVDTICPGAVVGTATQIPNPANAATASIIVADVNGVVPTPDNNNAGPDAVLEGIDCAPVDSSNMTFRFIPRANLGTGNGNTLYRVTLTGNIMTAAATPQSAFGSFPYSWQFTVSNIVDLTPPTVTSVYPPSGLSPRNVSVQIDFSEPVDPSTASGLTSAGYDKITLKDAGVTVQGSYIAGNQYRTTEFIANTLCGQNSCGGDVYCLPGPAAPATSLTISGEVTTQILDMAGNQLDQDPVAANPQPYLWTFDTSNDIDLSPPSLLSRTPIAGQAAVPLSQPVSMCFDERISVSSLKSTNVFFRQAGTPAEPNINFWVSKADQDCDANALTDNTEVFLNHDPYQPVKTYNPVVNSGVKDVNQNCYYWEPAMTTGSGQCGPGSC